MQLARGAARELDVLHDAARLGVLPEDLRAHVALGADLVHAARRRHDARPVARRLHPVPQVPPPLRLAVRVAAHRLVHVVDRRQPREHRHAGAREPLHQRRVLREDRLVPVRAVGEVEAESVDVGRVPREPLVPEAAEALHVAVEQDLPALAPDLAEAEEELLRRVRGRAAVGHRHAAGVELRVRDRLPRDRVRPRDLDRDLRVARLRLHALPLGRLHGLAAVGDLRREVDRPVLRRVDRDVQRELLLAPRRLRVDVLDERRRPRDEPRRTGEVRRLEERFVAPVVGDLLLARSERTVRREDLDLVLPRAQERRELDRAVRVERDAGLLPVDEHHEVAVVERLLEADASREPFLRDLDLAPVPGVELAVEVVAVLRALRERDLSRERGAVRPRAGLGQDLRDIRAGRGLDRHRAPVLRDVERFRAARGRSEKEGEKNAFHGLVYQ